MIGQTEVVVAREDDDVARLFHVHVRRHRRRQVAQTLVRPRGAQRVEVAGQFAFEGGVQDDAPVSRSRTILATLPERISVENVLERF